MKEYKTCVVGLEEFFLLVYARSEDEAIRLSIKEYFVGEEPYNILCKATEKKTIFTDPGVLVGMSVGDDDDYF